MGTQSYSINLSMVHQMQVRTGTSNLTPSLLILNSNKKSRDITFLDTSDELFSKKESNGTAILKVENIVDALSDTAKSAENNSIFAKKSVNPEEINLTVPFHFDSTENSWDEV